MINMKYQYTFKNVSLLLLGFVIVSTIFMGTQYAHALDNTDLSKNNDLGKDGGLQKKYFIIYFFASVEIHIILFSVLNNFSKNH